MESSLSPAQWRNAKNEVISWMDNELRCVTAQRISQSLNLTRQQGSLMLEEILKERSSKSQITYCQKSKQGNATVFRLQSSTKVSTPSLEEDKEQNTTLFALASLGATEMITTAHERDMIQWREMVEDGKYDFSSEFNASIAPADELNTVQALEGKYENANFDDKPSKQSSATIHKPFAGKPAKAVTAKDFFSARNKKKSTTDKAPSAGSKKRATTASGKAGSSKKPEKKNFFAASSSSSTTTKVKAQTEEKENKKNPAPNNLAKIGNADDFVADDEESDDEEIQVVHTTKRKPARVAPAPSSAALKDDGDDDASPPASPQSPTVRGAMDAFAERKQKPRQEQAQDLSQEGGHKRKRRKKMVEKTSMVNGYLRTEVQAVWEDIPTDEEEEEEKKRQQKQQLIAKKKSTTKPKKPQQMKQKSLVGFFTSKKK